MAGKQYGLTIIHKPSNAVKREFWFDTEDERKAAMRGIKLHENYAFRTEELEAMVSRKADAVSEKPIAKAAVA